MKPHFFTRAGVAPLAAYALITLSPEVSHAEQFVLFDETFDYTWQDAINATPSKSHYYVKESSGLNQQRPDNWVSPVDYRNGKVHIHLEVLEKPAGGQMQGWALCYVGNAGSYGCPYTEYYSDVGVYDSEVDMTDFYNNDTIDWSQGIKQVDLVYTINGSGQGHVHFFPDLQAKTTPTKVRIALVQLSAGATYDPSGLPGAGGAGGVGGVAGVGGAAGQSGSPAGGGAAGGAGGGSAGSSEPKIGGNSGTTGLAPTAGSSSSSSGASGTPSSGAAPVSNLGLQSTGDDGSCSVSGTSGWCGGWLLGGALLMWGARRRR